MGRERLGGYEERHAEGDRSAQVLQGLRLGARDGAVSDGRRTTGEVGEEAERGRDTMQVGV